MNKILTFIFVICLGILYPFTIRGQEQGAFFVPEEDREALQLFSFICSLAFDVYVKKLLMEKLIDQLPDPEGKK